VVTAALRLPPAALDAVASRFAPASTQLRDERELLRRVDTKYVCDHGTAMLLVADLAPDYAALPVLSGNVAMYHSLYFDTADLRSYHDHRRGRRPRHKVRIRHYPDRALSFLEVKTKRNEVVTDKQRLELVYGAEELDARARAFLRSCGLHGDDYLPSLRIAFRRLSLVGVRSAERVTIDTALEAWPLAGERTSFGELVVIEVKQSPFSVRTPIMRALHRTGLRERAMSKYTIATALVRPELPRNRLLPDVRAIERMMS
jgi:hypothetical protein